MDAALSERQGKTTRNEHTARALPGSAFPQGYDHPAGGPPAVRKNRGLVPIEPVLLV